MKTIKWGILGAGRIAGKFASDLKLVADAELIAIGSRTQESADKFGAEFNIKNRHASYEALVNDPEVDVIYIATPHNLHYENTLLCLHHNKAVLCEKPFAMNTRQAKEMIDVARERKLFLMEARWTVFHPHYKKLHEMIGQGLLGDVRSVLINFGFKPAPPVPARIFDPALGGGTLMDIGIYNVFMAMSVLGKPDKIEASMTPASTGVDEQCAILFKYNNGAMAQLFSTFSSNLATEADIAGTEGRIRLTSRFYEPSATVEYYPKYVDSKEIIEVEKEAGVGYQYEARHVNACLKRGLTESDVIPFADTLLLMETLDKIREIAGIHYASDKES
ncbi:Gfo/Idh/MocA family oxidoreductase [Mucilaginibacter sp. BJC16-A38]|uniref:Gfo/Idh/MocA family protein n=1 Tax=Mucilaginibacter phenanthrenivorans TaxID=1234842 RepID=UPI0021585A5F|nr:Gfo/Idh/MocA family oxidoreductase [Mucilaginibacter phenanthrenivorans]MCR8556757.1 Gfo/Idh/MocA family oxidoreductase [Mucilaginibacter phenanthrenivorans]